MTIEYKDSKRIVALSSEALVAHLKFNDDVTDSAGSNNGTVTGTTTYVTGKIGKAFSFNGSSYITLANESNFDFDRTDPFSVSLWLKTGTEQDIKMLVGKSELNELGWHIWMRQGAPGDDNGDIHFNLVNTNATNELETRIQILPMFDDVWHHLVWTYDGTSDVSGVRGYWDGVEISQGSGTNNLTSSILNNLPVSIGDTPNGGGRDYTGSMDDVRIYSRELDQSEVSVIYNGGTGTEENKPTNVQDNSLFIEKDTARRYWRIPESEETITSTGTYSQDSPTGSYDNNRQGAYIATTDSVLYNKEISSVSFWLKKNGSPTGTAYVRAYSNSNSGSTYTTEHEFGSIDVSTLTSSYVKYTFNTGSHIGELYDTIGIEWTGISTANSPVIQYANSNQFDGTDTTRGRATVSGWSPVSSQDIKFEITTVTPATWTMQPTFQDDFSSDNWTDSGSNVDISSGVMNFDIGRTTTDQSSYYQLSSALSDTKWVVRLHDVIVTTKSGGVEVFIGVSSNTSGAQTAQDFIGLNLGDNTANPVLGGVDSDGAVIARLAGDYTYSLSTTYNIEIIRESATSYRIKVFSNSGFDSTALFSQSYTCTATTTGLQYVKFANGQVAGSTENIIGTCSKIEIYNGVSTIN